MTHGQEHIAHDRAIGAAGDRHAVERAWPAVELFEGALQSAQAGAARENQRAVDVEEDKSRAGGGHAIYNP